ncbi:MAG: hypothetical protein AAFN11_12460, partial [Chloroflexota bacterium]
MRINNSACDGQSDTCIAQAFYQRVICFVFTGKNTRNISRINASPAITNAYLASPPESEINVTVAQRPVRYA